jgi:WD40 repeat protein
MLWAVAPGLGQQPAKVPALPPIAPGQARLAQTIGGLDGPGFAIAASDEAGVLAAACEHGTIRCWHRDVMLGIRAGEGTPDTLHGHEGPVLALAYAGGPFLASAGADRRVLVWKLGDGTILHNLTSASLTRALALAAGGKLLAGAGDDPAIQLWEVESGKPTARLTGHGDWVLALAFRPDGKELASGGYDGTVRLWDIQAAKELRSVPAKAAPVANQPPPADNAILALAYHPQGTLLAVGGTDAQVHLLNPADGKITRSLAGHTSSVTALAFHAGGAVLASGSKDGTVRLWDSTNGQLIKVLEGHQAWVQGVAFLAQGTRLASIGADQTVRLWDLTPPR